MKGRVALVTGAAQGIGKTVVKKLVEKGVIVAAVDINTDALHEFIFDLEKHGGRVSGFSVDVSDSEEVQRMVNQIERDLGPLHVLVNCAGVLRTGSVNTLCEEDWEAIFAVNSTGVFNVSRAVAKQMVPRQSGSIVTVSSNAAFVPRMYMAAYAASKAAATQFTKCLGLELADFNIRCNVVSPGSTETPMQHSLWSDEYGEQSTITGSQESFRLGIPLKRIANPSDIADAILFLISDQSRHMTMQDLCVDGGATLGV
ncbi:2,3-dihydro-2,3-dihydroxybenzoate dehydrogenase [Salibacterium salarium]|uniref:2,3-dihydro-2,3-dihydroxybenzoate dehydrogenase n=1 Tax=Salibacterium salarium TaxID=284579 RepID=UPI0027D90D90|nr:2,3-dihydro-2,3-dihydroxybenzoate dehydrogenase [Salibacterium salarium]